MQGSEGEERHSEQQSAGHLPAEGSPRHNQFCNPHGLVSRGCQGSSLPTSIVVHQAAAPGTYFPVLSPAHKLTKLHVALTHFPSRLFTHQILRTQLKKPQGQETMGDFEAFVMC
jgi:hypothetical protein